MAGEEVAEPAHEVLEGGVDRLPRLALLDHPVERVEHLADTLQLLRIGTRERLGHLIEPALGHFLPQALQELLEVLARL